MHARSVNPFYPSERLISVFKKVNSEIAEQLKKLNQCTEIKHASSRWHVYWGHGITSSDSFGMRRRLILPPPLISDLMKEMSMHEIMNKDLVIFQSVGEAYAVICLPQIAIEIVKQTQLEGSATTFAWVSQLASVAEERD